MLYLISNKGDAHLEFQDKKKISTVVISCVVIFTILYFITNIVAITEFISGIFSVLAPIIIGAAIAYILNPLLKVFEYKVLKKLKNKSVRRGLSILLTYVVAILIIAAFLWIMIPQIIKSAMDLAGKFDTYVEGTANLINSFVSKFISDPATAEKVNAEALFANITDFFTDSGKFFETVMIYVKDFGLGLFVGLKNSLLGFFISLYILIDKERLHAIVRKMSAALFKGTHRNRLLRYVRIANKTFGGFFIGKIIDSIIIGIITFFALLIFKIPYAPLVATIVGMTNVIPVFGPFIGAIPSAFIIFISSPQKALIFLILIFAIQQLDGNVIGPKILGNSTGISSLGVIISIVIMGEYFGIIGMIVGVPIFATITIVINELIEAKLKGKGLPHCTEDYYPAYSLVDPHEQHKKIGGKIFKSILDIFGGVTKLFKKKDKKKTKEKESDQTNEQSDK